MRKAASRTRTDSTLGPHLHPGNGRTHREHSPDNPERKRAWTDLAAYRHFLNRLPEHPPTFATSPATSSTASPAPSSATFAVLPTPVTGGPDSPHLPSPFTSQSTTSTPRLPSTALPIPSTRSTRCPADSASPIPLFVSSDTAWPQPLSRARQRVTRNSMPTFMFRSFNPLPGSFHAAIPSGPRSHRSDWRSVVRQAIALFRAGSVGLRRANPTYDPCPASAKWP